MHEVALAHALINLIEKSQQEQSFSRVTRLSLQIGALSCVDEGALRQGIEIAARQTVAEHAQIVIELMPATAFCMSCTSPVTVHQRDACCPLCGSARLMIETGEELRLQSIEVI